MSDSFLESRLWLDTYQHFVQVRRYLAGDPSAYRARKEYELLTTIVPRRSSTKASGQNSLDDFQYPETYYSDANLDRYNIDASKFDDGYDPADDTLPLVSYKSARTFADNSSDSDFDSSTDSDEEVDEESDRSQDLRVESITHAPVKPSAELSTQASTTPSEDDQPTTSNESSGTEVEQQKAGHNSQSLEDNLIEYSRDNHSEIAKDWSTGESGISLPKTSEKTLPGR